MIKDIKTDDLETLKRKIYKISAYSSLRNSVRFLALISRIGVIISCLLGLFAYGQLLQHTSAVLIPMLPIAFFSFIGWVTIQVIEQFTCALIDGVDLKLVGDQRAEMSEKTN